MHSISRLCIYHYKYSFHICCYFFLAYGNEASKPYSNNLGMPGTGGRQSSKSFHSEPVRNHKGPEQRQEGFQPYNNQRLTVRYYKYI